MKKALLIAYHFPPIRVSSGIQRTLSMVRYLRENGWEPVVLSISPEAYEIVSDDQLKDIPEGVQVKRAFGRDTSRHFSFKGRYAGFMALPDRWVSWFPGAFLSGINMIRREQPEIIWSTYPIATAHLIGMALARYSRLPWVADFRDSMTEDHYPSDRRQWKIYRWVEGQAVKHAKRVVFTTPGTKRMYLERYPDSDDSLYDVIPNGYDEGIFQAAEKSIPKQVSGPLRLLHSGVLYPSERDPTQFFDALGELKADGKIDANRLVIILRATAHDAIYRPMLADRNIEDIVLLEPGVGYEQALAEMMSVDGLLLFQAKNCNHQIPAKVYEYFRSGKPVIALTDASGDTAATIREAGVHSIFELDNKEAIKSAVMDFLNNPGFRQSSRVTLESALKYSRRTLVKNYSQLFDQISRN